MRCHSFWHSIWHFSKSNFKRLLMRQYLFQCISIAGIVSEEAVLKWFKDGHSQKGKMHFLEQMKKFIEWLQNAEEESESEDED